LFDHGGQGLCCHFENNLTESGGVVKWKEKSSQLCRERFETVPYRSSQKEEFLALGFQIGFALDAMRSALCALRFREKEG
jgi:hypothetical protein